MATESVAIFLSGMMRLSFFVFFISFSVQADTTWSAKAELGRYLFNDLRLSSLGNRSCAVCHAPELGWTNRFSRTPDIAGHITGLNTPSLLNVADYDYFTQSSPDIVALDAAIIRPLFSSSPKEMGMTPALLVQRLEHAKSLYSPLFNAAYQDQKITVQRVITALTTYVSTLRSTNTPWHQYLAGNTNAITREQRKGALLFSSTKLGCSQCHGGKLLNQPVKDAGGFYANTGLYGISDSAGVRHYPTDFQGLSATSGNKSDEGKFRIPSLVNITETGPWGHDGSFLSLSSVVDSYARGGRKITLGKNQGDGALHANKHPLVQGFVLSAKDKQALLAFFDALKVPEAKTYTHPDSPFCQLIKLKNKNDPAGCIPPYQHRP
ncbi:MAG: cytochrome-c peroxidase [Plesiomonas sp.]|uniref:cytochrome-c peroxidase n=1 Tax=Plesiomonas sp. TaxID=2486279 RepID=UPI003F3F4133